MNQTKVTPMQQMASAARGTFLRCRFGRLDEVEQLLESPLEEVAFWTLCTLFAECYARAIPTTRAPGSTAEEALGVSLTQRTDHWAEVWPQLEVAREGRRYRIDLAFSIRHGKNWVAVAAEMDGHAFHERTKEQAEADKRKDRDLQALGWRVVRFTGSQVLRDPTAVVDEILGFARTITKAAG